MNQLDANTLVAYVDGELDTESAKHVEALLAEDAEAARTARLLHDSALLVRAAHNHVVHEAVPDHLVDAVLAAEESATPPAGLEVPQHLVDMILDAADDDRTPAAQDAPGREATGRPAAVISLARRRSVAAVASAAAFAAVMLGGGFLLGQYQLDSSRPASGGQQASVVAAMDNPWREAALQEALETKTSNTAVIWTNPDTGFTGAIIPVKTYRRDDGTYCRAFRVVETNSAPDQPNYGVACREQGPKGRWIKRVEAVAGAGTVPKLSF